MESNRQVSQARALIATCRELPGGCNRLPKVLYIFEHKTQHIIIHTPYTHIVLFWHISDITQKIS